MGLSDDSQQLRSQLASQDSLNLDDLFATIKDLKSQREKTAKQNFEYSREAMGLKAKARAAGFDINYDPQTHSITPVNTPAPVPPRDVVTRGAMPSSEADLQDYMSRFGYDRNTAMDKLRGGITVTSDETPALPGKSQTRQMDPGSKSILAGFQDQLKQNSRQADKDAQSAEVAKNLNDSTMSAISSTGDQELIDRFQKMVESAKDKDTAKRVSQMASDSMKAIGPGGTQDKLEKQYADRLSKVISYRSGGLGLQDAKVNQAIDLMVLAKSNYDPKTKQYNIPPALHVELALGLARLLSPTGQIGIQLEEQLRQRTAREGLAGALIYLGLADPRKIGGSTQKVISTFLHSVERQGYTAESIRDQYVDGLKGMAPSALSKDRVERLNKAEMTSSFKEFMKTGKLGRDMTEDNVVAGAKTDVAGMKSDSTAASLKKFKEDNGLE